MLAAFCLSMSIIMQTIKRSLFHVDISLSDALLLQFCRRVQRIYGSNVVIPNMHMHCHLKSIIFDFGPVYAFCYFPSNGLMQGRAGQTPARGPNPAREVLATGPPACSAFTLQSSPPNPQITSYMQFQDPNERQ